MEARSAEVARTNLDANARWARIGRNAGYVAAAGFAIGAVLYLLDALDVLGSSPEFQRTAAGPLRDEANFWVAFFRHQHAIVWTSSPATRCFRSPSSR